MSTVRKLNQLLEVAREGRRGYETAAQIAVNPVLARLCRDQSAIRMRHGSELEAMITQLGGVAHKLGRLTGIAHRMFVRVTARVNRSDINLLRECERGDEAAIREYETILSSGLPQPTRILVEAQLAEVRTALARLDNLTDLRHEAPL